MHPARLQCNVNVIKAIQTHHSPTGGSDRPTIEDRRCLRHGCKHNKLPQQGADDLSFFEGFQIHHSLSQIISLMRSKEDYVQQISTFVFVTNFPDHFFAKDLWNIYKQYGYVVDDFIPNRTQRAPLNKSYNQANIGERRNNLGMAYKDKGLNGSSNSYAYVVKGSQSENVNLENNPVLMLDDSCLNQQDYTCCLMGKVKEFASLSNLKVVIANNGFDNIALKYMGGYWVMIKFQSDEAKKIFQSNAGIGTWFTKIQQASNDFFVKGRVVWVEIEGIPLNMWFENTFKSKEVPSWEPDFVDDNDDDSDSVNESYGSGLNGDDLKNDEDLEGFTPRDDDVATEGYSNKHTGECFHNIQEEGSKEKFKDDVAESTCSGHFRKSNISRTGGSILQVMEELVKVYAPQDLSENKMLWDYLSHVTAQWEGEVGFNKLVEYSGKESAVVESNAMIKMMKKLKYLKEKIRLWNKTNMVSPINRKRILKSDLADLNSIIDKGDGDVEVVNKRTNIVRSLQELEKLQSLEMAQKAKIKWAIEGDENSNLSSPIRHKFSNMLKPDQLADLDLDVSKDEIKGRFRIVALINLLVRTDLRSNSSFIALIPKTPDASMVKDLRPISLIGSMYKIIAKILANRFVFVLGDLVNEVQSTFVADRQILDGPFIMNEIVQWCQSKKKSSLVFKVDFEKAFDSVRWDYLDDILRRFGFAPRKNFNFTKGLKHGDPLSFFLFILVMESLHISFQRVVDAGQWNESNLDSIVHVLECFHRASGVRINMSKSKLIGIYVDARKVVQAARKISCVTLKTPFTYLGSKVGGRMSRIQSWNETIDGMATRLSKWKTKTLSIGGGLGISSLYVLNRALMFKWVWRFLSQNSSLWANVIKSIHGDHGKIGKQVKASYPSIWLDIVKEGLRTGILQKH
ncbi:RNA-directed DNA polymerase, eukaryota [Tanacetum coccineum]